MGCSLNVRFQEELHDAVVIDPIVLSKFLSNRRAVERLASESGIEERGAIYTKRQVVEFILDLVGYTADRPLTEFRLLEPSFGEGDFILPAVGRLLAAAQRVDLLDIFDSLCLFRFTE